MTKACAVLILVLSICLSVLSSHINATVRPLVVWHGLGDTYSSHGMLEFQTLIKEVHPGIFIHSIYMDEDESKDRRAGYYGNVDAQVEVAAQQLAAIPELECGFDAMGLSQGGQFLRAYVERYNSPPVHNLITFGAQHMGVSDLPRCSPYDFLCQIARHSVRSAVYSEWAQNNLVQAQYFRDPSQLQTYLASNHFLTSINNELPVKNETYKENLASLESFVMILFTEDQTVVPKESSWFGSESPPEDSFIGQKVLSRLFQRDTIPLRLHPIYTEDWIGLRQLDEDGRLTFGACKGKHMHMGECWKQIVEKYCGGVLEYDI